MPTDTELTFADHAGRYYARQYGFSPMAGRLLGYLFICDPPRQTIADLAEALLASRSAITGAVKMLEASHLVQRSRAAGDRVDHICVSSLDLESRGFDAAVYAEQAALAREGLALLKDASPARRAILEDVASLADFLTRRMPAVLEEWRTQRDASRTSEKDERG